MVIELPAETEQRLLLEAAARGMDLNQYATTVIHKGLGDANDLVWDDGQPMTEEEKAAIRAKVERGIADGEAGRVMSSDEVWARLDAKYRINTSEETRQKKPRPSSLCAGEFTVPKDFDSPLPDDILDAFEDTRQLGSSASKTIF